MTKIRNTVVGAAAVLGVAAGGYGIAAAGTAPAPDDGPGEANDTDTPLTGSDLDQAVAAALAHMGGGEVTETEVGDDGAAFGVEILMTDGSTHEVNLDADFNVTGSHLDD